MSQTHKLLIGHVLDALKKIPDESIDLVITSSPYWGLRDYGEQTKAKWGDGWFGQLGLEPDYHMFIDHIVEVCKEIKRVLKKTGSFYMNLGDTYSGSWQDYGSRNGGQRLKNTEKIERRGSVKTYPPTANVKGIPAKCLMKIPQRVELRLIDELGFIERNDIIWSKPNHMPSSVKDRLSCGYEHIFFFVKQQKYYYDLDAIRIPHTVCGVTDKRPMGVIRQKLYPNSQYNKSDDPHLSQFQNKDLKQDNVPGRNSSTYKGFNKRWKESKLPYEINNPHNMRDKKNEYVALDPSKPNDLSHHKGKNPGDVFEVSPEVRPKSKLGVPSKWESGDKHPTNNPRFFGEGGKNPGDFWKIATHPYPEAHFAVYPEKLILKPILSSCPVGGTVLDPFGGSGTTAKVARDNNRNSICIEINPDYETLWKKRLNSNSSLDIKYIVEKL